MSSKPAWVGYIVKACFKTKKEKVTCTHARARVHTHTCMHASKHAITPPPLWAIVRRLEAIEQ